MPAQTRSFVVFQDTPAPPKASVLLKAAVEADNSLPSTSREKENLHPVTGQQENLRLVLPKKTLRAKDANLAPSIRVLASKPIPVLPAKSRKRIEAEDGKDRELKKRRPLQSSGGRPETGKKRTRKLPKVIEDVALEALAEGFNTSLNFDDEGDAEQAKINARCYDLTVSPLADVSGAYEKCDTKQQSTAGEGDEVKHTEKQPPQALLPVGATTTTTTTPPETPITTTSTDTHTFSTPERRKIWAAFTFSSPSPASKRVLAAGSVFNDIPRFEFDLAS